MVGIYIHIPFCKQACNYCDFHFSTSLKKKPELVEALCGELQMRHAETDEKIKTIYFGGGTPSLLSKDELKMIFQNIFEYYEVDENAEITLEANPDDLLEDKIKQLAESPINRLSIGVQSFYDKDLKWMNRSHNADQALSCIKNAKQYFDNISIDLIYGVPGLSDERWKENLAQTLALNIPHVSAYALTVEPNTVLGKMVQRGKTHVDEQSAKRHYEILVKTLDAAGYINYEFSNFGKEDYFSQNNTAYWFGKPYLGIGPSAHGFDGNNRYWNVKNNSLYIKSIAKEELPQKIEKLSITDRYNEYIMTHLRTMYGVSLTEIETKFGEKYKLYFEKESLPLFRKGLLEKRDAHIHITQRGKFLGDGISADLFYVE